MRNIVNKNRGGYTPPWSDEHIAIAAKAWNEGGTLAQIGKLVGRKPDTVRSYFNRHKKIFKPRDGKRVNRKSSIYQQKPECSGETPGDELLPEVKDINREALTGTARQRHKKLVLVERQKKLAESRGRKKETYALNRMAEILRQEIKLLKSN